MAPAPATVAEADRRAGEAAVTAYARALDARDWAAFAGLFTNEVAIDYRSLSGTHGVFAARDWADRCRVLGAFDATLHRLSNVEVAADGDDLVVCSYIDAAHFIAVDGVTLEGHVCGAYHHRLRRGATSAWRIAACTLHVAGFPGGRTAFDTAFAAARARFSWEDGGKVPPAELNQEEA